MTPRLQLFITLLLHFEAGISGRLIYLHHRAGDDVVLPVDVDSSHYQCSGVEWIHYKYRYKKDIVLNGTIVKRSPGADRMSLSSNCSLIINNITAEDAGRYTCTTRYTYTHVYLNVLTVSPSPPDVDPGRDGDVTLRCSLMKDYYLDPCEQNSMIWVDETGSVLLGEGDGFVSGGQNNCVSDLMVKHQRRSKRRFTCRVVEGDRVEIDAEYTLDFTAETGVRTIILYHRVGDDVALQNNVDLSSSTCSNVEWIYSRDTSSVSHVFGSGGAEKTWPGAGRMDRKCSLIISNITAGDAGLYESRLRDKYNTVVYLGVLTISPSPPDVDPGRDGDVTLRCSLMRYSGLGLCEQNSIIWVDETGSVLLGEGDGFLSGGQNNCVSDLMVKHQRRSKRRFTCRVVEGDRVEIDAEYTLDFTAGTGVRTIILYHRVGDDVALQNNVDLSSSTCSNVEWIYSRDTSSVSHVFGSGGAEKTWPGAGRMDRKCSLIISNITAGDAGLYESRLRDKYNTVVYLSVLTISPSPPDVDPGRDGNVTLRCSLVRDRYFGPCEQNSIIWVDETGSVLLGEGDGFVSGGQNNCVSDLMVKHQRRSKRRFTCQVVEGDRVEIDAEYTLDFTDYTGLIIGWVVRGLMVVLVIIATFLIIYWMKVKRNNPRNQTDVQLPMQQYVNRDEDGDDDDDVVNYENDEGLPASVRSTDQ
ncbi:uncharacterized protein LOC133450877 [Cololabis saira]|uniref:uncharacterized protein LOC133450877 n=1 Tax=Cololabis saira TaxID=129043 RepID=UPI002AD25DFD|nr:uncharacterized protein LOC133450877 [Cololabis saira]